MSETKCRITDRPGWIVDVSDCPDRARLEHELAEANEAHLAALAEYRRLDSWDAIAAAAKASIKAEKAEQKAIEAKRRTEELQMINAGLRETLRDQDACFTRQATEIGNRDQRIENQRVELKRLHEKIKSLEYHIAGQADAPHNANVYACEALVQFADADQKIKEKDEQIRSLQTDIAFASGRLADRENELSAAHARIRKLEGDLISAANGYNEDMQARGQRIAALKEQIRELKEPQAVPVGFGYHDRSAELIQRAIHDERMAELQQKLKTESERVAKLLRTISDMANQSNQQAKKITYLENLVEAQTKEITRLIHIEEIRDRDAGRLHRLLADREEIIGELRSQIEALKAATRTCCYVTE